jgi:prepilin signal peptidase PulO-like enzyme (type II secretory pathway)
MTLENAFMVALITLVLSVSIGLIVYGTFYVVIAYLDPDYGKLSYVVLALALLLLFTLIIYVGENNLLGLKDLK